MSIENNVQDEKKQLVVTKGTRYQGVGRVEEYVRIIIAVDFKTTNSSVLKVHT